MYFSRNRVTPRETQKKMKRKRKHQSRYAQMIPLKIEMYKSDIYLINIVNKESVVSVSATGKL